MNTSILEEVNDVAGGIGHAEVHSIYNAMQQLQDRRRKQGKRYPVELVLTYLLLAKAAGETTLQAATEWIRLRGAWLQEVLPQAGPHFPCAATYSNVLRAVDPVQLNELAHVPADAGTSARTERRRAGARSAGWQNHSWNAGTSSSRSKEDARLSVCTKHRRVSSHRSRSSETRRTNSAVSRSF